jgi:hypothetical protein
VEPGAGQFVKQTENGATHIFVVDLAIRLRLRGEQGKGATAIEFVPAFANEGFADT